MFKFYYYIENEKLNRLHIDYDNDPCDPRTDFDGNVGHMMCWHRDYFLGDKNNYKNPDELLNELIQEVYKDMTIINMVRKGKLGNNLEIKYNRADEQYELLGDYRVWWNGNAVHHGEIASAYDITWLIDDVLDALAFDEKIALLERKGFYFLPLAIYDHSGITMYVGSKYDHFDGRWDCSNVGWIYTTKSEILKTDGAFKGKRKYIKVTERNWKQAAEQWLESEVKTYDQYLTGQVYGYVNEIWDGEEWDENDSCWGYYSDKWGEALAREIADIDITSAPFISKTEANEFMTVV